MDGVINNKKFIGQQLKCMSFLDFRYEYCKYGKYYIVPELQKKINDMLMDIQDCKVVWSSSWRLIKDGSKLFGQSLYYGVGMLQDSWLDRTPYLFNKLRSDEIKDWIDHHKDMIRKCVVIDDMEEAWNISETIYNDIPVQFINTDMKIGITDEQIEKIKNWFKD